MSEVFAKFEAGRKWISHITRLPARAYNIHQCTTRTVFPKAGGASMPVGAVVAECLRNDKGVQIAIILPNGYAFPTGRLADEGVWFQMLKPHVRSWLAMTEQGRVIRVVNEGLRAIEAQIESGQIDSETGRRAVVKLEEFRSSAIGEMASGLTENDLLAQFYNWVTEASASSGLAQVDLVTIIDRALRTGKKVQVPDLSEDVLNRDFQRYLDM